jgi:hypothetical protein
MPDVDDPVHCGACGMLFAASESRNFLIASCVAWWCRCCKTRVFLPPKSRASNS